VSGQVLGDVRPRIERLGDLNVTLSHIVEGVFHTAIFVDDEFVRFHPEVVLDILDHGIPVVNDVMDMMYKVEHGLSPYGRMAWVRLLSGVS
jgi:hypothetical protein